VVHAVVRKFPLTGSGASLVWWIQYHEPTGANRIAYPWPAMRSLLSSRGDVELIIGELPGLEDP